ncbi:MAG: hypothetical protein KOO60_06080 [Gemmatimonadales bacterium]|nr:hypothetical protein [Gemmatimonadales bacterium]
MRDFKSFSRRSRVRFPAFSTLHFFLLVFLLGLTLSVHDGARAAEPIPLAEITRGMSGFGLSVFEGSRIDTFEVKVIGVQANTRAAGSLILVEVAGHGLEVSRVVQGMSGSPIFLDGRFAGALAFGWSGSLSPIAGVTPAEEILALPTEEPLSSRTRSQVGGGHIRDLIPDGVGTSALALEMDEFFAGGSSTRNLSAGSGSGGRDGQDLTYGLKNEWPAPGDLIRSLLSGMGSATDPSAPGSGSWICQPLNLRYVGSGPGKEGTVAYDAVGSDATAAPLAPGSACAIPLIIGDALLGAIGTVTWVQGEHVFMMGHPFMQRGPVNFPLASAEILTVLPSRDMSFKMGSIGPIVGSVHHDQRAGLSGRLGVEAPLIPVEVTVESSGLEPDVPASETRTFRFQVVDDPFLTPTMVFWALYNSLLVEGDDASLQSVEYTVETTWEGHESLTGKPLILAGTTSGPSGVRGLANQWMAPLAMLLSNPFDPVELKSVQATLRVTKELRDATIVGLTGPRTVARPGSEIVYRVELAPRKGENRFIDFPMTLPDHLAAGPYRIVAASAAEFFALEAQRATGRFQVRSLQDTVELLATPRSPSALVLAVLAPGRGLVLGGKEMSSLPGSVHRLLRGGNLQADPTLADFVLRREQDTTWTLQGHAILELHLPTPNDPRQEERRP